MKGISPLIASVIYVGIALTAIGIVLNVAVPTLERMQDSGSIENGINFLTEVDSSVREVASGGQYSSRTLTLRFQRGNYVFDGTGERIYYGIETSSGIISTNAHRAVGPVNLTADNSTGDKVVRVVLSYESLNLFLQNRTIAPGIHEIRVRKEGTASGRPNVSVSLE